MMHSRLRGQNNFEPESVPQRNSPHDANVNDVLIAIAQEVAEFLKQSYSVQTDEFDGIKLTAGNSSAE